MTGAAQSEIETRKPGQDDPYVHDRPGIAEEIRLGITQPRSHERAMDRTITVGEVERMPMDVSDIGEAAALVLWHYRIEDPTVLHRNDAAIEAKRTEFEARMDRVKEIVIDGYKAKKAQVELLTDVLLAVFDPDEKRGKTFLEHIEQPINELKATKEEQ